VAEGCVQKNQYFQENDPVLEPFDVVDEFLMVSPDQIFGDSEYHLRKGNEYCGVNTGPDSTSSRVRSEDKMGPIEPTGGLSSRKCEKEVPIWSIYTDLLQYSDHDYHKDDLLYQPFTGHQYKKWKRKTTGYKIPHINLCEDFYPDVKYDLKSTYDPHTDISATYLWAQSEIAKYRSGLINL